MTRLVLALACAACLAAASQAFASGPAGSLTQPPSGAGCTTDDGKSNGVAAQCADGRGLGGAEAIVVSPDGRFAYSYSYDSGAIAILSRDTASGVLAQADSTAGCTAWDGLGGLCIDGPYPGPSADSSRAIALSPDGAFLFAATGDAQSTSGVSSFQRDAATGALTPVSCVSGGGVDSDGASTCTSFAGIGRPQSLAISSDGRFLYVGSLNPTYGLAVLSIGATGALAPLGDPDGCFTPATIAACTTARYAHGVHDIALSPDGHTLYAANETDGVALAYARDAASGRLSPIDGPGGCVYQGGPGPDAGHPCTTGRALASATSVSVSPDGALVTVGTYPSSGGSIAVLGRDVATGQLGQAAGAAGCVNMDGAESCGAGRLTDAVYGLQFTPDGRELFAASYGDGIANHSGIAVFDVGADGALTQRGGGAGCYSDSGADNTSAPGTCTAARGILGPVGFALSPDNGFLYVGSYDEGGVAGFRLEQAPVCSAATASTAFGTPVSIPVACTDGNGDALVLTGAGAAGHGSLSFDGLSATYTPAAGFAGDDSFQVRGNDGVNDSAPVTVTVHVGAGPPPPPPPAAKKTPAKLSLGAKPRRDRRLPFRFTFSGRLTPAAGTTCSGKVTVTVKRGRKTVAKKAAKLSSSCRWKAVVKIKNRKRLGTKPTGKLTVRARYGGNAALNAKASKAMTVRYG